MHLSQFNQRRDTILQKLDSPEEVWGNMRAVTEADKPSGRAFLEWMSAYLDTETKKDRSALKAYRDIRRQALALIAEYVEDPGQPQFAVDPYLFAVQLAVRVRKPALINQGSLSLCGPNSFLVACAKKHPVEFARFGIGLMKNGRSQIRGLEVEPTSLIRWCNPPSGIQAADYVLLASVRNSPSVVMGSYLEETFDLTKPGVLCGWLRSAGYEPEDHTFFEVGLGTSILNALTPGSIEGPNRSGARGLANLESAQSKLASHHLVIVNSAAPLVKALRVSPFAPRSEAGGISAMSTHWTFLTQLTMNGDKDTITKIKLYSNGGSIKADNVPVPAFLTYYCGFVSAASKS